MGTSRRPLRVKAPLVRLGLVLAALSSNADVRAETSLGWGSTQYRDSTQAMIDAHAHGKSEGSLAEAEVDASAKLLFQPKRTPLIEFEQAYLGTSSAAAPVSIQLGRKLEEWSHLDESWHLGIWQPRFRWDYLSPESVGLTGAFFRAEGRYFKVVAMSSPLFIPERGTTVESCETGRLCSTSHWFLPPVGQVPMNGQSTPVQYHILMPEIKDVVLHPGGSIMARVGKDYGFWSSAAYAYKPVNQILLAFDAHLSLSSDENQITIPVQVHPRVVYHHLSTIEVGFETRPVSVWFSILDERPSMDEVPTDWTSQELSHSRAVGSSLAWRLTGARENPTELDLSYLHQWGGNGDDQGAYATRGKSLFELRYPLQNAVRAGMRTPLPTRWLGSWAGDFTVASRLTYDLDHLGSIFSADLRYAVKKEWIFAVGTDVLSSEATEDTPGGAQDFISRYRAYDRVRAGVSYVF